ncbi:SpoVG family protein [Halanaerobium congolense]|jgi:stage V sporulation protein G|uniref:Stage V sporulation protein G n=1 Tax=Halanaerobium congolense TaxID=54121 RepID=A0A1M7P636_9FIRM|nr:SpoVG family protein [Halanaerobium congolense]TDX42465.1 stage V sporulation protein G [Halanaerobium congolense]SHN12056.1 stage V sporulation protein G [Halanaerobium congolense]
MEITDVRVFPVNINGSLVKAYATVTFDDAFVIREMRVVEGKNGTFLSMPARRKRNGNYQDICFPISTKLRDLIENEVLEKFNELLETA